MRDFKHDRNAAFMDGLPPAPPRGPIPITIHLRCGYARRIRVSQEQCNADEVAGWDIDGHEVRIPRADIESCSMTLPPGTHDPLPAFRLAA